MDTITIKCPHCGKENRCKITSDAGTYKCGACKSVIHSVAKKNNLRSEEQQEFVKECVERYRTKLLDTSKRNPLISFNHSERSRQHVRIIDELPDFLYGQFLDGKIFTFRALPEEDEIPSDEKTIRFRRRLVQAKLTDEEYRSTIDAIDHDVEGALDLIKQIDRDLRNKIRAELGLPVWDCQKNLSNLEVAKKHGLNPSYEMPLSTPENQKDAERHLDKYIQLLLRPEEMSRKLSGLASYVRSDIDESGVNTLYVAFGFLQWYESESSDKCCTAPLLLLQLEIEKKQSKEGYTYKVQASGEEPEINISLLERMKRDFGFNLPEFTGEDSPELYIEKVSTLIKNTNVPQKDKWRARRFITIGRFRFARLVMFHDLNPGKWPGNTDVSTNSIVQELFSGTEDSGGGIHAEDYHIDTPEIEKTVPLLITAADASQHSALVDVMKGNNLAIKGPPGTGKSQTITNIIACALAKGKTVLFLAEKMAALNVVYNRLNKAGLSQYCLELHSTKAKKIEILKSIQKRLEQKSLTQPNNLVAKIKEFKKHRDHIKEYIDILNSNFGRQNKTVHDYLWATQLRKERTANLPGKIRQIRLPYEQANLSDIELSSHIYDLKLIVELKNEVDNDKSDGAHPWEFIQNYELNPFQQDELKNIIQEWTSQIEQLSESLKQYTDKHGIQLNGCMANIGKFLEDTEILANWNIAEIDANLLEKIGQHSAVSDFVDFFDNVHTYRIALDEIAAIRDIPTHLNEISNIEDIMLASRQLAIQNNTASEIKKMAKELEDELILWQTNQETLFEDGRFFGLSKNDNMNKVSDCAEIPEYLASIPREYLLYRTKNIVDETNAERLKTAYETQNLVHTALKTLEEKYDLSLLGTPYELRTDAAIIEGSGFFKIFNPDYRKARRVYKLACRYKTKFSSDTAVAAFREIATIKDTCQQIEQDLQLRTICGSAFNGIDTDFQKLQRINEWASDVRKRFSGPGEFERNIRHCLLNEDMEELDSLRSLANNQGFIALKIHISESMGDMPLDMSASEYLNDLERRMHGLNEIYAKLKDIATEDRYTFVDIANDLPSLKRVREFKINAEENSVIKDILSDNYKGAETYIQNYAQITRFLKDCLAVKSVKTLVNKFLAKDFAVEWKKFIEGRKTIKEACERTVSHGQSAEEHGRINAAVMADTDSWEKVDFIVLAKTMKTALDKPGALNQWIEFNSHINKARSDIKDKLISAYIDEEVDFGSLPLAFEYMTYGAIAREIYRQYPNISRFSGHSLEQARSGLKKLDEEVLTLQRDALCRDLNTVKPLSGIGSGRKSTWSEGPLLCHQMSLQRRHAPIRDLMRRAGRSIQKIKPCFLMSPLTVAQYLQPGRFSFDLIVIDEASQMRPEDAMGGVARANQIVVVGDPQQLPPTSFFQQGCAADDDGDGDCIDEAIMDMALSSFRPARILSRHYRSQHESLIAFSNHHFYDRSLILFPSPVKNPDELGIRLEYVGGTYAAQSNMDEVQAVVKAVLDFMRRYPDRSLGVATINKVQKDLIESEMERAFLEHPHATNYEAKWKNTLESFFIKNLESVQGDERDAIFISTVYGPDKNGTVMQRFGPINWAKGERRLNVLFTRAKKNMVVFTSLKPEDIKVSDSSSKGLHAFRGFLAYASKGIIDEGKPVSAEPDSDFEIWVKERLDSIGCEVIPQVGVAGYRIDLGVKHPKYPYGYLMGIECDGASYHSSKSARERDIIRQQVLENLGWKIYRIWSTDWFSNPVQEFEKLKKYIETLLVSDNLPAAKEQVKGVADDYEPEEQDNQQDLFVEKVIMQEQEPHDTSDIVQLYDNVTYVMIKAGGKQDKRSVQIVPMQGDPNVGTINRNSAIGRALLGASKGEEIEAILPIGEVSLVIQNIDKFTE